MIAAAWAAITPTAAILATARGGSSANPKLGAKPVTVDTQFPHTLFLLRSGRLLSELSLDAKYGL